MTSSQPNPELDPFFAYEDAFSVGLRQLRQLALASGLAEERKWKIPVYTLDGKPVLAVYRMREAFFGLSFWNGPLVADPNGLLVFPGPNSKQTKRLELTDSAQVEPLTAVLAGMIASAIQVARSGAKIEAATDFELEPELVEALDADPEFAEAFAALTPGRQRSHNMQIGQAKQHQTRLNRIEKARPKIFAGKGWNEY